MTDGLISSFAGRMWLLGIWAFFGVLGTTGITTIVMLRKGLPLTTQTNRVTGVREHGVGKWWLFIAAFCLLPQLLLIVAVVGVHLTYAAAAWVGLHLWLVPVVVAGVLLAGVVWWYLRQSSQRVEEPSFAPATPPPAVPAAPTAPPAAMWSMPEIEGNWADRHVSQPARVEGWTE